MEKSAFGTDRLRIGEDGTLYLSCRHPKEGWIARRPAEQIRREFPGTCVRWQDDYFEVRAIQDLPVGVRYALVGWSDSHTMRVVVDYDDSSEVRRDQSRQAEQTRRAKAAGFNAGAVVTGLLPAEVQEKLEGDLGVSGFMATLASSFMTMAIGGACLIFFLASALGSNPLGLPVWVYLAGIYFFIEALIRVAIALGQSKPIGSLPVVLVWEIVAAARGKRPLQPPGPKLKWELDESTIDRDAYTQREPFLALLAPGEQRALAERYGFDWSGKGRSSATLLLIFAVFVIAVTIPDLFRGEAGTGDLVTLLLMGYLCWEQILRFQRIGAGEPAGSVLGAVVRPFSRKLFR